MKVQISIVVPMYNAEKCIERCIKSVVKQNYKNLEMLIIDDGSNDNSAHIVKSYQDKYSWIIYHKKKNGGVSSARNEGIYLSNGKYIIFLDADDELKNNMCTEMIDCIERDNADIAICGFETINEKYEKNIFSPPIELCKENNIISDCFEQLFWNYQLHTPWNKIFRKDKIEHLFNEKKSNGEDLEFVLAFLKNNRKIALTNQILYVNHSENKTSLSKDFELMYATLSNNHKIIFNYLNDNNIILEKYNIGDYFISQIWSTALLILLNRKITSVELIEKANLDEEYIKILKTLNPLKLINKFFLFVLINRQNNLYILSCKLLCFYKYKIRG